MYKGIDTEESKSPVGKSGGITTSSYEGLRPSAKGTSTVNTHDEDTPLAGSISSGMAKAGGVTTDSMADVKRASKGSFNKPCKPGTDASYSEE